MRELAALTMGRVPADRVAPLTTRLDPARADHAAIVAAHERALARGDDGYLDPTTGYHVFTAQALWDRGACCHSGCRHCPFAAGTRASAGRSSSGPDQSRRGTE